MKKTQASHDRDICSRAVDELGSPIDLDSMNLKSLSLFLFLNKSSTLDDLKEQKRLLLDNPELTKTYQEEIRFMAGRSGEQNTDEKFFATFDNAIKTYNEADPLTEVFQPSQVYLIGTYRSRSERTIDDIDEDVTKRANLLRDDIQCGVDVAANVQDGSFDLLFTEGKIELAREKEVLLNNKSKFEFESNEQALYGVDKKLLIINRILNGSTSDFIRLVKSDYDSIVSLNLNSLNRLIRMGVFGRAIYRSIATKYIATHIPSKEIDNDTLIAISSFVDDTIMKIDYSDFFSNPDAENSFQRSISTKALRCHISDKRKRKSVEPVAVQFIPSRTLGLYFSGATGDSCLDGSTKKIADIYPDTIALSVVRDPGSDAVKLVGSVLIMKTTEKDSTKPVYVIRAINPIVNFINYASVESFYQSLVSYIKSSIGDSDVAIVIDSNGQASTNRPVIATYLENVLKPSLSKRDPIIFSSNTKFENYSLDDKHPAFKIQ